LISAVFRNNPEPAFLIDELKSIYDPNGGSFRNGKYVPSLAAEIGYVIEEHMVKIGLLKRETKSVDSRTSVQDANKMICPECHERELVNQENCLKCLSCNYSKCG
jgi:ribonucleoside-diphosphate reductase alpha chain